MPGVLLPADGKKKRKHDAVTGSTPKPDRPRKAPRQSDGDSLQAQILTWEEEFLGSQPQRIGHLEKLRHVVEREDAEAQDAILAAVALCRIFCRLIAAEQLAKSLDHDEDEAEQVAILRRELHDYTSSVGRWIGSPDATKENTAVALLMRVVKSEASQNSEVAWQTATSTFNILIRRLIQRDDAEGARQTFIEKYVEEHDDVRFYFFRSIKQVTKEETFDDDQVKNLLDMLVQIEGIPESVQDLSDWYGEPPSPPKHYLLNLNGHRKAAQEAWMVCFRADLTEEQRKKVLTTMNDQILPWFSNRLEILTDFITDSFNASSSTAVLALEGMFHLMTQRNIDYPEFYARLYSLLDEDILHSKHRSRFLRLLNKCLDSSHLPATLIASFMKRLSRLALQAPPGAVVWLVPWTYNMLRQHPSCTFMLQRTEHPAHAIYATYPNHAESGMDDPFDMTEKDPVLTKAIDSSLWEIQTLAAHYHPNVATLASILSEQFTKREYQLDDFLDHSYSSLLTGELDRSLKKAPEVEWEIPKRILTAEGEPGTLNALGSLLQAAMDVA